MEISDIITVLRKAEHVYEGEDFPRESYDLDTRLVLELDEDQNRLYNAILRTIPKETLAKLHDELEGCAWSLLDKIEWMSKEHPKAGLKHNESISTLLKLFLNKASKKVGYARKCLTNRFDKQSYRDQNKILRAFLRSGAGDCDWAGRILRDNWRKEMTKEVKDAWTRTRRPMLAYAILRHFPKSYILSEQDSLSDVAGYQYVCAEAGNEIGFTIDMSRLSLPERLYVMAKLGRQVDSEETEKKVYNFLLMYDKYYEGPLPFTPNFSSIKGWDRMVWAMGVLGMQDALVRLLEFEDNVKKSIPEGILKSDSWPYFVAAIKDAVNHTDYDKRIETEKIAYEKATEMKIGEQSPFNVSSILLDAEMNNDDDEQKEWYFYDELSKHPLMTLEEEWDLFVESFYYDRPRLQNVLKQAIVSNKGNYQEIAVPVRNDMQESWLLNGPLDGIKRGFEDHTRYAGTDFDIKLQHTDDYQVIEISGD